MVTGDYWPGIGGAEKQLRALSKFLHQKGSKIQIITRKHGFEHLKNVPYSESVDGIDVFRIFSWGKFKFDSLAFYLCGLSFLARQVKGAALFHAHAAGVPGWLAVSAARIFKGKSLLKLRSGTLHYQKICERPLSRLRFFALLLSTNKIITVNQNVGKLIGKLQPSLINKIKYIPNGVDTDQFRPVPEAQKKSLRQKLGLNIEGKTVLFTGRLVPGKHLDLLLESWRLALSTFEENSPNLFILGQGESLEDLKQLSVRKGLETTVHFLGEQKDVIEFYQAADFFVLPSESEGLSNSLLEAMATETIPICSNVDGALDLIEDNQNGFLFESGNLESFTLTLKRALQKDAGLEKIGKDARQKVLDLCSMETITKQFENIYQELMA